MFKLFHSLDDKPLLERVAYLRLKNLKIGLVSDRLAIELLKIPKKEKASGRTMFSNFESVTLSNDEKRRRDTFPQKRLASLTSNLRFNNPL